jgi:hypothetical protein
MNDLNKKAKLLGISMAAAGLFAMTPAAQAASFELGSQISFAGTSTVEDAAGNALTTDLSTAAQLNFGKYNYSIPQPAPKPPITGTVTNKQWVATESGSFVPFVNDGDAVTFKNFKFSPLSPSPVSPLWSVDGFTFILTSLNPFGTNLDTNSVISATTVSLLGKGILAGHGFGPTLGTFNLTTQNGKPATGLSTANNFKLSFSASTAPVPVPAALFFAAPALLGVFGVSRRKNAASAA